MAKKFTNVNKDILLNNEWWCSAGGEHCADVITTALNELIDENQRLNQFKDRVFKLLDKKIRYYRKQPCLAVRLPVDCEYRNSCLHNTSVNVCNKAKENAFEEFKKLMENYE